MKKFSLLVITLLSLSKVEAQQGLPFYNHYLVSDKINQKSKLAQKSQSDLSSFVQDSFSGIRVIKSYNKENYISEMYQNQAKVYKRNTLSLVNTEAINP